MLAASIHLSRGTPYIYMGEEIGMIDQTMIRWQIMWMSSP